MKAVKMKKWFFIWLAISGWVLGGTSQQCVVTMGYKTKPKEPYIFTDNTGIYADVYGEALSRIGCQLKIVRMPKLRIIQKMKKGEIDFYPVYGFTVERSAYTFFIRSYIEDRNVLVTRRDYPEMTSIEQLIAHKPILLKEIGGYSPLEGIPARRFEATGINIRKKVQLLLQHRIDAFSYPVRNLEYYLKKHPEDAPRIRIHNHFFPQKKFTLGFSRFSPYASDRYNPSFDPAHSIAEGNLPTVLDPKSVAGRFAQALKTMYMEGGINEIYDQYRINVK